MRTAEYDKLVSLIVGLRIASGTTQKELCDKLGQEAAYMSKVERGVRRLDLVEFCDIAFALGRDPKEIFSNFIDDAYGIDASEPRT